MITGQKHNEITKEKMRLAKLGKVSPHKGTTNRYTLETLEKMRQAKLGRKLTPEHIARIVKGNMGKKMSDSAKKRIGDAHRGKPKNYDVWNKGIACSKETREKISKSLTGHPSPKKGIPSPYSGANHYNWKGGITSLYQQIRTCLNYKQWHQAILGRDYFRCVECKSKKELEVDHIKSFAIIVRDNEIKTLEEAINCKEMWDINNGRTLCWECHKQTASYGKKIINILSTN